MITVPYEGGDGMLWQTEARFRFDMAGGYVGIKPSAYRSDPVVHALSEGTLTPSDAPALRAFLAAHHVGAILVLAWLEPRWRAAFAPLHVKPIAVGGIVLYMLPGTSPRV